MIRFIYLKIEKRDSMKFSKNIIMFMLMFIMFITFNSFGLIIPVMPTYLKTFGAAGQVLGFIIALFAFGQFLFSPLAGTLSDRYGRKKCNYFWALCKRPIANHVWPLY